MKIYATSRRLSSSDEATNVRSSLRSTRRPMPASFSEQRLGDGRAEEIGNASHLLPRGQGALIDGTPRGGRHRGTALPPQAHQRPARQGLEPTTTGKVDPSQRSPSRRHRARSGTRHSRGSCARRADRLVSLRPGSEFYCSFARAARCANGNFTFSLSCGSSQGFPRGLRASVVVRRAFVADIFSGHAKTGPPRRREGRPAGLLGAG